MLNCQSIKFYSELAEKRTTTACNILGTKIVKRILAFALYLLGAHQQAIAELLNMPLDTIKSCINRVLKTGITAFEDGRRKASSFVPSGSVFPRKPSVCFEDDELIADFGINDNILRIPARNILQIKTIALTMLNNGLITISEAARILGCSTVHTSRQNQTLLKEDVHALIDKRQGQKQDYLFSSEIKAELVQQFAANAVTGKPLSSRIISEELNKRCNLSFSDRSIRLHMRKLGLPKIAKSLPTLVETLKKTSRYASEQGK
jgi:transposase